MKSFALFALLALSASTSAYRMVIPEEVEPVAKVVEALPADTHYEQTPEALAYEEEGRSLSAQEYDKQAFIDMLETLLWDADSDEELESEDGRSMRLYKRRGVLRMQKPQILQEEGMASQVYRSLQDKCYSGFCALGLGGFPTAFFDLFSALFK